MRHFGYGLLIVSIFALGSLFLLRRYRDFATGLPIVERPPEIAGRSCDDSLALGRTLAKMGKHDRAGAIYLWVIENCGELEALPAALIEAGSLYGHFLNQPEIARRIYAEFLRRFGSYPLADTALYQLAKLDLDAGDYASATAKLVELEQRFPTSPHRESAAVLAARATEILSAERRWQWTLRGQLAALVPNNILSFLILMTALGPVVLNFIIAIRTKGSLAIQWLLPILALTLTLANYAINNMQSAELNAQLSRQLKEIVGGYASDEVKPVVGAQDG